MAKFNIFRLKKETERNLLDKFRSVGLMLCNKKEIDGFTLTLFISKNPKQVDIWWVDLYDEYLDVIEDKPKNKVYFGVFLISNESLLYAVSMGKSHFYLKEFCDLDFGINMAERIADNSNLKLKNSKLFGSKRNKSIISYQNNSEFEYDSGESIHFLKSESIDKNIWGKMVSFGNSIQIELDITPDKLPDIVLNIESELKK
ncbi:TPA: TIGR04141 family sporadically distributed protein, partial [Legionella pneumophila]|nr:TIGR04141 family sporadically distributed protein [Legionella pneumophila]